MAKLYPPNIEGTIPAFYKEEGDTSTNIALVVPFSMNKAVSKSEVKGFSLKLKYVDGTLIDTFSTLSTNLIASSYYDIEEDMKVVFSLNSISKILKVGSYYKVQIAYIDETNTVGYYSTIGVTKYTTQPLVIIDNIQTGFINPHQYSYVGVYRQQNKDTTEKLYQYRFLVTDNDGKTFADTGYLLHNTSEDDLPYEAREEFILSQDLDLNKIYYIQFKVKTINGISYSSVRYRIFQMDSIGTDIELGLKAKLDYENGFISLSLVTDEPVVSGTFLISKASSKTGFQWSEFRRFDMQSMVPKDWSLIDCTIEQGVTYKYSLQQYNEYDIYSARIVSEEVYADFEHAYLYDGIQQLKIKFDPKITNFKNNLLESKQETIGSKFPFIIRNGNVYYKSFDIQGLISFQSDEKELFLDKDNYITDTIVTDLTSNNIAAERIFKREVQDWLNNGQPKIFKSCTEGNFIVRLLNVSLTPNDKLGRMLHSFKATAYEIAEFNEANLAKYHLIDPSENLTTLTRWKTVDLSEYRNNTSKDPIAINDGRICYSVDFVDLVPGTKIYLQQGRHAAEEVEIGSTGAYYAESPEGFSVVSIRPYDFNLNYPTTGKMPSFTYSYKTKAVSVFGLINKVSLEDVPIQQFIGNPYGSDKNILDTIHDVRITVGRLNMIRFKKRNVQDIFVLVDDPRDFDPENLEQQFYLNPSYESYYHHVNEEEQMQPIDLIQLDELTLYRVRCSHSYHYYEQTYRSPYGTNDDWDSSYTGYYVDNQDGVFRAYTDYYLDGKTKKFIKITDHENEIFSILLNDEELVDIEETEEYTVQDTSIVTSIKPGPGVITELSYTRQISKYVFDDRNIPVKTKYRAYLNAKKAFEQQFKYGIDASKTPSVRLQESEIIPYKTTLDQLSDNIKTTYNAYVAELDAAILQYKIENGLDI